MNPNFSAAIFHQGKKLTEEELMELSSQCPICASRELRHTEFLLQSNPDVALLHCEVCGGRSASRMPTSEALDRYYGVYYASNNENVTFHNVKRFANHIQSCLKEHRFESRTKLRILDYGGGNGSLSLALAKLLLLENQSVEIVLIDYNIEEPFIDAGLSFYSYRNIDDVKGQFDIVICSAVLEHIPNLQDVLIKLYGFLAVNGFFYARTPYIVPFKRIIKNLDFTYPGHVHDLGPDFWNTFSKALNFEWKLIMSRSSIVETQFTQAFFRTLISYLFKFPSRIEEKISGKVMLNPRWRLVGGWEVIFNKT